MVSGGLVSSLLCSCGSDGAWGWGWQLSRGDLGCEPTASHIFSKVQDCLRVGSEEDKALSGDLHGLLPAEEELTHCLPNTTGYEEPGALGPPGSQAGLARVLGPGKEGSNGQSPSPNWPSDEVTTTRPE